VDQYHTGFAEWKGQLFSRLGVDKALGGFDEVGGLVLHEKLRGLEFFTPKNLGAQVNPKPANVILIGGFSPVNLCELFFGVQLFGPEEQKSAHLKKTCRKLEDGMCVLLVAFSER